MVGVLVMAPVVHTAFRMVAAAERGRFRGVMLGGPKMWVVVA